MENKAGQSAFMFLYKQKNNAIRVSPDQVIDPVLLFQRFLVVSKTGELSLEDVMGYELSPFPPCNFRGLKCVYNARQATTHTCCH